MNIADRFGNFSLLRERLATAKDKNALMQLEMIRISALDEFREMTKPGKLFKLGNETIDGVRRHKMSVEERESVAFSIGGEGLDFETAVIEGCLNADITLRYSYEFPHCVMLNVLAIIENVTDGNGIPTIPMSCNFHLLDDANNIFIDFISVKLPLFYPEVPISNIILLSTDNEVIKVDLYSAKNVAMARSIIETQKKEHDS